MAQKQTARDAMNDTAKIGPDARLADAARTMRDQEVAIISVVDESGGLIGVVTDRDIAILAVAEGADPQMTKVGDAMSEPVAIDQGESLDQAFQRMLDEDVHRAPVTQKDGQVSGMLSQHAAVRQGEGRSVGESGPGAST